MNQWLKVEFYAQLPDGQAMQEFDPMKVAEELAKTFGFRYVDALSVVVAADRGYPRSMLPPRSTKPEWIPAHRSQ
jgi:hypothetical protein